MSNETRDEIKSYITRSNWKIVDIVERLKDYGIHTTPQALSNKLSRDTIRYSEVKAIAEIIGYKLTWKKEETGLTSVLSDKLAKELNENNSIPWSKNFHYSNEQELENLAKIFKRHIKIDILNEIKPLLNNLNKTLKEEHKSTDIKNIENLIDDKKEKKGE